MDTNREFATQRLANVWITSFTDIRVEWEGTRMGYEGENLKRGAACLFISWYQSHNASALPPLDHLVHICIRLNGAVIFVWFPSPHYPPLCPLPRPPSNIPPPYLVTSLSLCATFNPSIPASKNTLFFPPIRILATFRAFSNSLKST